MSHYGLSACIYCGHTVARYGDSVFSLRLGKPGGECVELRWHMESCAESDQLHMALAEALNQDDGPDGDDEVARLYLRLLDRTAERGVAALRASVDVRRDTTDTGVTLRGDGLLWGRRSARVGRST